MRLKRWLCLGAVGLLLANVLAVVGPMFVQDAQAAASIQIAGPTSLACLGNISDVGELVITFPGATDSDQTILDAGISVVVPTGFELARLPARPYVDSSAGVGIHVPFMRQCPSNTTGVTGQFTVTATVDGERMSVTKAIGQDEDPSTTNPEDATLSVNSSFCETTAEGDSCILYLTSNTVIGFDPSSKLKVVNKPEWARVDFQSEPLSQDVEATKARLVIHQQINSNETGSARVCLIANPNACVEIAITANYAERGSTEAKTCNLGKFGWALCAVLETIDKAVGGLYGYIEGFLTIPVEFIRTDSPTYQAWTTFRNIANIAFIILFLFVIFSQVTGIGINNYGIKKIFPQLIVTALLINLSFFICQGVVDISNIVGTESKALLENLGAGEGKRFNYPAENINISSDTIESAYASGEIDEPSFVEKMASALGLGSIVGIGAFLLLGGGWGILLAVAAVLLAGLVAAVMIFAILIIRQIGVVVLVVVAPLAFAARLLPNTDRLFKTWANALKVLLVVFPVCGFLMGGGALAGRIIGGLSKSTIFQIAAMAATILPFFAVVAITKGAISGLGKIGGTLTGGLKTTGNKVQKLGEKGLHAGIDPMKARADIMAQRGNGLRGKIELAKQRRTQKTQDITAASVGGYAANSKFGSDAELEATIRGSKPWQFRSEKNELKMRQLSQKSRSRLEKADLRSVEGRMYASGIAAEATAQKQLVEQTQTIMKNQYGNNIGALAQAVTQAGVQGDTEKITAGINLLASAPGGAGKIGDVLRDVESQSAGGQMSEGTSNAFRSAINNEVNARPIGKKDAMVTAWASNYEGGVPAFQGKSFSASSTSSDGLKWARDNKVSAAADFASQGDKQMQALLNTGDLQADANFAAATLQTLEKSGNLSSLEADQVAALKSRIRDGLADSSNLFNADQKATFQSLVDPEAYKAAQDSATAAEETRKQTEAAQAQQQFIQQNADAIGDATARALRDVLNNPGANPNPAQGQNQNPNQPGPNPPEPNPPANP